MNTEDLCKLVIRHPSRDGIAMAEAACKYRLNEIGPFLREVEEKTNLHNDAALMEVYESIRGKEQAYNWFLYLLELSKFIEWPRRK